MDDTEARSRLISEARRLYVPRRFGYKRVGRELGVAHSTVYRWLNPAAAERGRTLVREYKARQRGACVDCGAETRYTGHGASVSPRCVPCGKKLSGLQRRGHGPKAGRLLTLLQEGPRRYSEIVDLLGVSKVHAGVLLNRQVRYGTVVRVARGMYEIGTKTVQTENR